MTSPIKSYTELYDAIEKAYEAGASDIEMCKILKIRKSKFDEMYANDKAFRDLIDIGRMMREAYWMEVGRVNMFNPKFNRNTWQDFMKNEFGWSEKTEVKTDNSTKTMEELKMELAPVLKELLDKGIVVDGPRH